MLKKQLEITKENYKGYLEFFNKADKERNKQINKIIHILGGSFLLALIISICSIPLGIGIATLSGLYCTFKSIKLSKQDEISEQLKKEICEKYPNINTNLKYSELYKLLCKEGLIKSDGVKDVVCEEIRKETLTSENREYRQYIHEHDQSEIPNKQVKQKVKVLTKVKR